jgi:Domain of unknown function (DUF4136)
MERRAEMSIGKAISALVFLLCVLGVASRAQTVQTDFDRSYDFSKLRTFTFVIPDFDDPLGRDSLNDGRIRGALESNMKAVGFGVEDLNRPDFIVAYSVTTRRRFNVQDTGPRFFARRDVSVDEYTEGTLGVDIYDGATRRIIWRGRAVGTLELKATDKKINKAAEKLVKQFLKDTRKGG